MTPYRIAICLPLLIGSLVGCQFEADVVADTNAESRTNQEEASTSKQPVKTRLFWQDRETMSIRWVDVLSGEKQEFGSPGEVSGFPELDSDHLTLVQMKEIGGVLLAGVRDDADGTLRSGWIAIDTGVREEPHGNHSHWHYDKAPKVIAYKLDAEQGNPAHLYIYNDEFYLANDQRDGYTRISPKAIRAEGDQAGQFYPGGGNHITLAAVDGQVGYSSWIDGGGPNAGRIDVTRLSSESKPEIAYHFNLPTGVIHGAATAKNKVFFAPKEGICWVTADPEADDNPDTILIHHIDLGTDADTDTPRRTGAFAVEREWIMFTTGNGESTALGLIDASEETPKPILVDLEANADHKATTPVFLRAGRKRCAALFLDYEDPESDEELLIVDLDPNRDRDRSDAAVVQRITVGNSDVRGHSGHHNLVTEPGRDVVFVVHPGDASLTCIDVDDWSTISSLKLTGKPSGLLSVGGESD